MVLETNFINLLAVEGEAEVVTITMEAGMASGMFVVMVLTMKLIIVIVKKQESYCQSAQG